MYFTGCDQFNLLGGDVKQSTQFTKVVSKKKLDVNLEWDSLLYSETVDNVKTWFFKSVSMRDSMQVHPPRFLVRDDTADSKAVLAGNKIFVLDSGKLYSIDLTPRSSNSDQPFVISEVILTSSDYKPNILDITSSGGHCFALDSTGSVYKVPDLLFHRPDLHLRRIFSGYAFNLAMSDTGALYSWGNGSRGELGLICDSIECETPQRIDFFDDLPSVVVDVACGGWHSLALTSDGDVYSWGWNESGQLGHSAEKLSSVTPHPFPIDLGSADDPVQAISAGSRHSVAVMKSGRVFSWGLNKFGQLGVGDLENRMEPTEVRMESAEVRRESKEARMEPVEAGQSQFLPSVRAAYCGRWSTILIE